MNFLDFKWMNQIELKVDNENFTIMATPNSDFFNNPFDGTSIATAPFLYKEIDGDFLIRVCVKPTFLSTYDACSIFIYADEKHWLKTAFEYTDLGINAIVTVVTDNYSDDANGAEIKDEFVHLQVVRKGTVFACHYSIDGVNYRMARLMRLNVPAVLKIGVSAQSPTGKGQFMEFKNLEITQMIPEDIRNSI